MSLLTKPIPRVPDRRAGNWLVDVGAGRVRTS
jgi:hypothetical protein